MERLLVYMPASVVEKVNAVSGPTVTFPAGRLAPEIENPPGPPVLPTQTEGNGFNTDVVNTAVTEQFTE